MSLSASFREALSALRTNALRSFLTMLGIIIGVAAVITMVSVGSGAQRQVEAQINSLGTNMLNIFPGSARGGGRHFGAGSAQPFTEADVAAIKAHVPSVSTASGTLSATVQIVNGNMNWSTGVTGVMVDYLDVRDWRLESGRNFSEREVRSAGKVVIFGQTVADKLFEGSDPVGQTVRIKKVPFKVIGVLQEKGQTSFGRDQDDTVLMPLATARNRIIGKSSVVARNVRSIQLKVAYGDQLADAKADIEILMRKRRRVAPGADDNFVIYDFAEFLRARNETQEIFSKLLGAAAAISLIVGGIGIMNIMLVSVTERTREIGLRLAVGARKRDIMTQFLVEAITLCLIGGVIGITMGLAASAAISRLAHWPTMVGPEIVLIAVGFSIFVGVFFGFYPARKASRLNPIDALRFE